MSTIHLVHESFLDIDRDAFDAVDALIVDPPYSAHVHENAVSAGTLGPGSKGYVHRNLGFAPLTPLEMGHLVMLAARVKRWSVFFTDTEAVGRWKDSAPAFDVRYVRHVPWLRWSQPQKSGDRPGQQSESVVHFHRKTRPNWNGPGWLIAYGLDDEGRRIRTSLRGGEKHPTEKPLDLMLDMVCWYSERGETVADTHMGRGTTGLACRLLERDFVGIERRPSREELARGAVDWFPQAKRRLEALGLERTDTKKAEDWCATTIAESRRDLAKKETGSDEKTRARAEFRLREAERLAKTLRKVAA